MYHNTLHKTVCGFILCIIFVCAILVYLFVTDYALVIYRVIILFDSIQLPILVGSFVILT
jgi:hypothetical protein